MVRAILDGTKTQTRRQLYTLQKCRKNLAIDSRYPPPRGVTASGFPDTPVGHDWGLNHWQHLKIGDRLWVKETWRPFFKDDAIYLADAGTHRLNAKSEAEAKRMWPKWQPSIHMPRKHARIVLDVVGLHVERLHKISEADALAEGVVKIGARWEVPGIVATPISARAAYAYLWEFINGPGSWHLNPWVRMFEFSRVPA